MTPIEIRDLGRERHFVNPELQARADQSPWSKYRLQYAAVADLEEIGFLALDLPPDEDHLVLYELCVARKYRRRSFGRRLVELAESVARQRGASPLLIRPGQLDESISEGWLRTWYARQGYEPWFRDPDVLAKDVRESRP